MQKPIPGFPGYEITDDGRVWSCNGGLGRFLRPDRNRRSGHLRVTLSCCGKTYRRFVHRLVLEVFIGPCPDGMEACHGPDPDPANNNVENLRWDTSASNHREAVQQGRHPRGEQHGRTKLTSRQVRQMIYTYRTGLFSMREIAAQYGIGASTVHRIIAGKVWGRVWT
jgi:hypothetical protein